MNSDPFDEAVRLFNTLTPFNKALTAGQLNIKGYVNRQVSDEVVRSAFVQYSTMFDLDKLVKEMVT